MKNKIKLMYQTDFYKVGHKKMYPEGTTNIYSVWTARNTKFAETEENKIVFAGLAYFINELTTFSYAFFNMRKGELEQELTNYKVFLDTALGGDNDVSHWRELHELGHMPLIIKAKREGIQYDVQTPLVSIENTDDRFFWLPAYLETYFSSTMWQASTSATIAHDMRAMMLKYYELTGSSEIALDFAAHDFSYRGMGSNESAIISGMSHLMFFKGSDSIPAIKMRKDIYGVHDAGFSVNATEHSVMCAGGEVTELDTYRTLMAKYPKGILSIVSDTWDYFDLITNGLRELKDDIMAREIGDKIVIRPDSGNPLHIVCGDPFAKEGTPEAKGSLEILGEIFGYTLNEKGFKVLDPHIGLIYGDGMNMQSIEIILSTMVEQGWAAENIVFGVGSFQYQYNTRDTYSHAFKATSAIVNGVERPLLKNPKTDPGKKSLSGRFDDELETYFFNGEYSLTKPIDTDALASLSIDLAK